MLNNGYLNNLIQQRCFENIGLNAYSNELK